MSWALYLFVGVVALCILLLVGILIARYRKGSVVIVLERSNYAPGDTVRGSVKLLLKKHVDAAN